VLILTQQWVRRSRKGQGSAACTVKDERSGAIRSKPSVRVSRVRLKVCFLEDEIQRGVHWNPLPHDGLGGISTCGGDYIVVSVDQPSRRAVSETAKGIESQPNHDSTSHSVNAGSPNLIGRIVLPSTGRRSSHITQRLPVMGLATGRKASPHREHNRSAMVGKTCDCRGKGNSSRELANYRKEEC
jgi:hypothetical protein